MGNWTNIEEVEARYGHLRGTQKERFLQRLLDAAIFTDLMMAHTTDALLTQGWTHFEEIEHYYGSLRGTPREPVLRKLLDEAKQVDEREVRARDYLQQERARAALAHPERLSLDGPKARGSLGIERMAGLMWLGVAVVVSTLLYRREVFLITLLTLVGASLVVGISLENALTKLGIAKPGFIGSAINQFIKVLAPRQGSSKR